MNKILIIEDDRDIADLISIHMEDSGYDTRKVFDGKEGLIESMEKAYDLIILDLKLPGMDGLETLERVKEIRPEIRVIILTGHGSEKEKIQADNLGAYDYLQKPIELDMLMAAIQKAYEDH